MQNVKLFFPCHSEPAEESPNVTSKRHSSRGCYHYACASFQHDTKTNAKCKTA